MPFGAQACPLTGFCVWHLPLTGLSAAKRSAGPVGTYLDFGFTGRAYSQLGSSQRSYTHARLFNRTMKRLAAATPNIMRCILLITSSFQQAC